jgi:hypothetical protein
VRAPILALSVAVLTCVGMKLLMRAVTAHRQTPVSADGRPSALPFDCVASAVTGSVELTVTTPGCFGLNEAERLHFDWTGDGTSMRSRFGDATAIPRAALVGFLTAVSDRALSWRSSWERCREPWGHLGVEARWTCVDGGGSTIRGYSTTDYPLCKTPSEPTMGETVRLLMKRFRERWQVDRLEYVRASTQAAALRPGARR